MIRKTELIRRIAKEQRLTQKVVMDVVGALERQVKQALKDGNQVELMGFGKFYSRERKEGKVRDFRTGEVRTVPAGRVAAFSAGALLRKAVKGATRGATRPTFGLQNPFAKRGKKR